MNQLEKLTKKCNLCVDVERELLLRSLKLSESPVRECYEVNVRHHCSVWQK